MEAKEIAGRHGRDCHGSGENPRLIEVIECALLRRGAGEMGDPVRVIRQFFDKDGFLLAEVDPHAKALADLLERENGRLRAGWTYERRLLDRAHGVVSALAAALGAAHIEMEERGRLSKGYWREKLSPHVHDLAVVLKDANGARDGI